MGSCGTANNDKNASIELNNGDIESKPTGILEYINCCNCSKKPNYLAGSVGLDVPNTNNNNEHNNDNNNDIKKIIIIKICNEGSDDEESNYNFLTQSKIKDHNDKYKKQNKGTKKTEPFKKNKSIFVYGEEGIIN